MFTANDGSDEVTDYYFTKEEWENRPDADGYVSYLEGVQWLKDDNTGPLFIDASTLELNGLSTLDFNEIGEPQYINLLYYSNIDEGLVLGNNFMTLLDENGNVLVNWDVFNYDYHEYEVSKSRIETWVRNRGIDFVRLIHGFGFDSEPGFKLAVYGVGKVKTAAEIAKIRKLQETVLKKYGRVRY